MDIQPTDLVVIAIVLLSALLAFARGLVREVLSVAGWVGAAIAALLLYQKVMPLTVGFIRNPTLAMAAAGAGVFIVALIVLTIVSNQIANTVRGSALSAVDRSLGFLFGLGRGAVLVSLAYLVIGWIWQAGEQPPWIRDARTRPWVEKGADVLRGLIPEQAQARAADTVNGATASLKDQATHALEDAAQNALLPHTPPGTVVTPPALPAIPATAAPTAHTPAPGKQQPAYKPQDLNRLIENTN